ncbi:11K [Aratus pisonii nudivirus]|nr:11K [Aratus pisonii nudivirus]
MNRTSQYLRPECGDISKALMLSGGIEIALLAIVFIMIIFAASYNNMYNPTDTADLDKKEKYINGLIVTSAVIVGITLCIGIWHVYVSGKAKKCLEGIATRT